MIAPSWAVPGAKVVCVDATSMFGSGTEWADGEAPQEGAVYTIRRLWINPATDDVNCDLEEIRRCKFARDQGWGYALERFRPLVNKTIEDDIALFKHLLNTTPVSEDA